MKVAKKVSRVYKSKRKTNTKSFVKAVNAIANKVIQRAAEKKSWFAYGTNIPIPATSLGTPEYKNCVPTLVQGVQASQRVGNAVTVKGGYIKGYVNLLPYDAVSNNTPVPVYVKMWLISAKDINTNNLASTQISVDFLDILNGSIGLQGNMLDMILSVNNTSYTVHAEKIVKLGVGAITSVGPVGTNGYYEGSSQFSAPFNFNIGKYLKTLKFDDASSNTATNKNLFLCFQCISANGGTAIIPAEYHYAIKVDYTDL